MKIFFYLSGILLGLNPWLLPVNASDAFWKSLNGGSFQQATNWFGGVPGSADNAHFTNGTSYQVNWLGDAANAKAFFGASQGVMTQAIGSFRWSITNDYSLGSRPGASSIVVHASGTLSVTNPERTAQIILGQDGFGKYRLEGGAVIADRILATNRLNPVIVFAHGNLTTRNGTYLDIPNPENGGNAELRLGNISGKTFRWDSQGGSNVVDNSQAFGSVVTTLGHSPGSRGILNVDGQESQWVGNVLLIGGEGEGCQLIVTNGGQVFTPFVTLGGNSDTPEIPSNHSALVSGVGSLWQLRDECCNSAMFVYGVSNQISVIDGGTVEGEGVQVSGTCTTIRIGGPGSTWKSLGSNNGFPVGVELGGHSNQLIIADGGQFIVQTHLYITSFEVSPNATDNTVLVGPGGSLVVTNDTFDPFANPNLDGIKVGSFEGRGVLAVHGGTVTATYIMLNGGANSVFDFRSGIVTTAGLFADHKDQVIVGDGLGEATLNLTAPELLFDYHHFQQLTVSSNARVNLRGTNMGAVGHLIVTNGPTSRVSFESGNLTATAMTISNELPFVAGNGSDTAKLVLLGTNNFFANGLVISSNSLLITSGDYFLGHVVGDLTLDDGAVWEFDLESAACPESNKVTHVIGNVALFGIIEPLRVSKFVPATYSLFTYTGTVATNGLLFSNVPRGFAYSLDLSQPGIAGLRVTFTGPAPSNSIVNPVRCGDRVSLSFETRTDRTYVVEYKDDLNLGEWTLFETVVGTGRGVSVVDQQASIIQRFYRLRTQ